MADITPRKVRFDFSEVPINFDLPPEVLNRTLPAVGLSLTMPYLEPYLIRTMKVAGKQITDPVLAEDVRHFSQQEGHHYRAHADLNARIRDHFPAAVAAEIRAIEEALDADYQRFTREKSLRFNLGYAEGFEAMTCATALASAEHGGLGEVPGGMIWAWHMAEEIEHRTVAFDVYEHLVGSYPYRIVRGFLSQWHYLRYVLRFARVIAAEIGHTVGAPPNDAQGKALRRNYLRTWGPGYNPAKIELPEGVAELLAGFDKQVQAS